MQCLRLISIAILYIIGFNCIMGIFHGKVAWPGQFKYSVHLSMLPHSICGGAIISVYHILTAGHCVWDKWPGEIIVLAGTVQLFDARQIEFSDVKIITVHEDFKPIRNVTRTFCRRCLERVCPRIWEPMQFDPMPKNDIAVLTLQHQLPLNEFIGIIPYKPAPKSTSCPCEFAGWGRINENQNSFHLRYTTLSILSKGECKARYAEHRSREFCAMDKTGLSVPMEGDSGSVLVCSGVAVGIQSTMIPHPDYPATFTKIADHVGFIDGVLKIPVE